MGKKRDKMTDVQKPDPMSKDWVMRDMDSGVIYLLESWLEAKSQETGDTISDVFTNAAYHLVLNDWGIEKIREKNTEYNEQQKKRGKSYIENYERTVK